MRRRSSGLSDMSNHSMSPRALSQTIATFRRMASRVRSIRSHTGAVAQPTSPRFRRWGVGPSDPRPSPHSVCRARSRAGNARRSAPLTGSANSYARLAGRVLPATPAPRARPAARTALPSSLYRGARAARGTLQRSISGPARSLVMVGCGARGGRSGVARDGSGPLRPRPRSLAKGDSRTKRAMFCASALSCGSPDSASARMMRSQASNAPLRLRV